MNAFSLLLILFLSHFAYCQQPTLCTQTAKKIDKIFKSYVNSNEGVDSEEHKNFLLQTFSDLQNHFCSQSFSVLLDVWMYYDPTDFPTRNLIQPILEKYRSFAIKAINHRLQHKKSWEGKNEAPYADLILLKKSL